MFCGNCGKQNPDDGRFCTACGSALDRAAEEKTQPVQQTVSAYQAQPVKRAARAKKKSGGLKKIVAFVVAFVVCFAASFVATSWENSNLPDVDPSNSTPSTAYDTIFWNNGINTPPSDFEGQNLKTVSYAIDYGEGMVENMEYVYEKGAVLVMVDTFYVPVYYLDDVSRAELNDMMLSNLGIYTSLSCCQLSSCEDNEFYVYKLIFTDLNEKENVHQLCQTGLISIPEGETYVDRIGIKITEDSMLASGYTKR